MFPLCGKDMNERERLIELLYNIPPMNINNGGRQIGKRLMTMQHIADHLLANGVIVPPCKVGDKVYEHQITMWMDECDKCEHFRVGGFGDPHECARTKSPFKHPDCTEIQEVVATQKNILLWLAYGDFGKTVFLTKAEAEKALAERGKALC